MNKLPLVSILIPTYNRADYIGESIKSALNQTYPNIEVIVHDDASTDDSLNVICSFHDPRLRIIHTKNNHGMIGGWNYIQKQAKGKYIKFLASDDLLAPECVAKLVAAAENNKNAAIVTCQRQFIDDKGYVIKTMQFSKSNQTVDGPEHAHWVLTDIRENKIGEPTAVLYPTKLVKKAGVYDNKFSQFADFEYWIRLLKFGDLVYVHEPLCSFRVHPGSNTTAAIRDGRFIPEIYMLICKYYHNSLYRQSFYLTEEDEKNVRRKKTLDILKNIKDLAFSGHFFQALRYAYQLICAIPANRANGKIS